MRKGVYAPPPSRNIDQHTIAQSSQKYGYDQIETKGLYQHKTCQISFTLVVDGFGICYKKKMIYTIFKTKFMQTISPPLTPPVHFIVASKYTGIITNIILISPCPVTSNVPSHDSIQPHRNGHSTHIMHIYSQLRYTNIVH